VGDIPVLKTERLRLRPWIEADRALFAEMNSDPRVMEHFPSLLSRSESDALMDRIVDGWRQGYGLWAVERREDAGFIGFLGFSQPRWEAHFTPCIEIGWRLAASSWNQGLATEAAWAALSWGRENVAFPRNEVVSFTTSANAPSRRVMEKVGMTHDPADDFDHPLLPEWVGRRHVLYRLAL
jgi:RimJ/RimL family protein N-acetyltransferase